jgi:surfactin synthase thioesterase subunit
MSRLSPELIAAIDANLAGQSIHELSNDELLQELRKIHETSPEAFQENNPLDQLFKEILLGEKDFS